MKYCLVFIKARKAKCFIKRIKTNTSCLTWFWNGGDVRLSDRHDSLTVERVRRNGFRKEWPKWWWVDIRFIILCHDISTKFNVLRTVSPIEIITTEPGMSGPWFVTTNHFYREVFHSSCLASQKGSTNDSENAHQIVVIRRKGRVITADIFRSFNDIIKLEMLERKTITMVDRWKKFNGR